MDLASQRILVTGAGGFIGSHLARELHRRGYFVRAVDVKWDGYMEEPYYSEKLTLDLREPHNCLQATKEIDWVFNLAADMGGIGYITTVAADLLYHSSLINLYMLRAAVINQVKRFFYSSSACVYPEYRQLNTAVTALKEAHAFPAEPDTFYGWEKLYSEKLCEAFKKDYGLDIRVARFHNIYGPRGTYKGGREKAPAALCRKVAETPDPGGIEIWGDGKQTRSYCFMDDCVEGVIRLMISNYDKPLNIGSDRLISVDDLADLVIGISGKKISKSYNLSAPQGVRGRNADLTLMRQVLNWTPQVSLEDGLRRTYEWIAGELLKDQGLVGVIQTITQEPHRYV